MRPDSELVLGPLINGVLRKWFRAGLGELFVRDSAEVEGHASDAVKEAVRGGLAAT